MKLATACTSLDALLGGGVEGGAITLVLGEAGTGKTNLCLQLSREAVLGGRGKVAYVDTEGVSMERLHQIAGDDADRVLKGILFFAPQNLEDQERMVGNLEKIKDPSLIIVDSLNLYYRLGLAENGGEAASRTLTNILGTLLRISRRGDVPILVTAQVYTAADEDPRAFGGRIMEHIVKAILRLERLAPGIRRATIVKHRSRPEGESAEFRLVSNGLTALSSRARDPAPPSPPGPEYPQGPPGPGGPY